MKFEISIFVCEFFSRLGFLFPSFSYQLKSWRRLRRGGEKRDFPRPTEGFEPNPVTPQQQPKEAYKRFK